MHYVINTLVAIFTSHDFPDTYFRLGWTMIHNIFFKSLCVMVILIFSQSLVKKAGNIFYKLG